MVCHQPKDRDFQHGEQFEIICYGADGDVGGEGYDADIASTK
jgi:hypothetical protein